MAHQTGKRYVCKTCGANYSTSSPPKYDWTCDACGGEVVQRQDDTEAAIRRRLELYEVETEPLIPGTWSTTFRTAARVRS